MSSASSPAARGARNHGVDALRILAMFMVAVLHILGHGGVLDAAKGRGSALAWLVYICAFSAVNCYALISGYVGYTVHAKRHASRYVTLWLQVLFYSLAGAIFAWASGNGTFVTVLLALMPVTRRAYWYFSAYTGVALLAPWLNRAVARMERRELRLLMLCGFVGFCCVPFLCDGDPFSFDQGYTFVWLAFLYVAGCWLRKEELPARIGRRTALLGLLLCLGGSYLLHALGVYLPVMRYISPAFVVAAVLLLALFAELRPREGAQKIITFFAPAAFGVYLIHDNDHVRNLLMKDAFRWIGGLRAPLVPLAVLGCAAAVFILCAFVEKLRALAFRRPEAALRRKVEALYERCEARMTHSRYFS